MQHERLRSSPPAAIRAPLHDGVVERLREMIIRGELQPGDHVSEMDLVQRFGVSRTPLREALKLLAAEGLVEIRPHRGAVISQVSLEELSETFALMSALEEMTGPLVCERVSNVDLRMLEAIVEEMEMQHETANLMHYFELNMQFHHAIVGIAGNRVLARVYSDLFGKLQRARYRVNFDNERWQASSAEHRWIMEAMAARNGGELGRRLKQHNDLTAAAVISWLMQPSAAAPQGGAGD